MQVSLIQIIQFRLNDSRRVKWCDLFRGKRKRVPAEMKMLLITMLIGISWLGWAWLNHDMTTAAINRGFLAGGG